MPSLTRVMILYCGQGMTTLVEIYDDGVVKDSADYLALIDCGGTSDGGQLAVDYVAKKILDKKDAVLNLLVISHQDADHVQLLSKLEDKLSGTKATLAQAVLGGSNWSNTNIGTVESFVELMEMDTDELEFDAPKRSDYKKATKRSELKYIDKHGDTYFRVLISGLAITGTGRTADIVRNASSAMVVVENGSYSVFLPGDATHQTMDAATDVIDAKRNLIPRVVGLEIPHHGALRTAVEDYYARGEPDDFNWRRIKGFAEALSADWVVASAGPKNSHRHPVREVLNVFDDWLITIDKHGYNAYVFDRNGGTTSKGWTNYETTNAKSCTIQEYNLDTGVYQYGDIEIRLTKPGILAPKEMVRFIPRARSGALGLEEDLVVFAPAPPQPAPAT
ncbi:hypothetical protein [Actinospica sp.]|jgi:beta-lactamase superfamily II metal-dependent hydrolase|uniref:hypothetical protein n=1 Tax=Actinospica sp. TaxID=1872142 RepID=UPI002C7B74C0|nr:hypothetical protein [Actinospica sp.]HWG24170.1 hypothetical protein [Actinospica sp.]